MGLAPQVSAFFEHIAGSLPAAELSRVRAAWALAEVAHHGQTRQSGEPYVTHPLAVAGIVFESLEPDADTLCAALLHDVVEDSDTSLASIEEQFGARVAHIVDGVSKLDQVRTASGLNAKEETLRKLVAAGGRDWRVFAVKLCDRLHNMRTLGAVSTEKRRRVSTETIQIFFPLARYVGFHQIAVELEALSLKWLYPWRWQVIERWSRYKATFDARRLDGIGDGAAYAWLSVVSEQDQARALYEVMTRSFAVLRADRGSRALFGMPVVPSSCVSSDEAYQRIGSLHKRFVFVPLSFACELSEGIASTKILVERSRLVAEMLFYFPRVVRGAWVREIGDAGPDDDLFAVAGASGQAGDFTKVLRSLVAEKSIFVFSPKGRRLSLPLGSSGLDFAFAIHTDLGLRANGVKVNGVVRNAGVKLASGDIVEVIASDEVVARPEWEAMLRSPRSRAKLRQWLRDVARSDAAQLGKRLLADALGIVSPGARLDPASDLVPTLGAFGAKSREELWSLIGTGELSAFTVASTLRGQGLHSILQGTAGLDARSRLTLDGRSSAGLRYCDQCLPLPGDDIVAVSSFAGATIHRGECPHKAEGRSSNDYFVPSWAPRLAEPLPTDVVIQSTDRKGLLADCARVISDTDLNVTGVRSMSYRDPDGHAVAKLRFRLLVQSPTRLEKCLRALQSVAGVTSAGRAKADDSREDSEPANV